MNAVNVEVRSGGRSQKLTVVEACSIKTAKNPLGIGKLPMSIL